MRPSATSKVERRILYRDAPLTSNHWLIHHPYILSIRLDDDWESLQRLDL